MRAYEFLLESALDDIHDGLDVSSVSLPNTFMIPELSNSNFYEIYRFGVALAAVRGDQGSEDGVHPKKPPEFRATSEWGQHPIVTSFDPTVGKLIDQALLKVNKRGKKAVSTPHSDEMSDTNKRSPLPPFKGYSK